MKIGIVGAGNIGGTVGKKWAEEGYEVVFGVREPQAAKVETLLAGIDGLATATTVDKASEESEVVLIATPGDEVAAIAHQLGTRLDRKILIDATNNVRQPIMHNLDVLQEHAPHASLYRAFNTLGWENFAEPVAGGVPADLFYCGDGGEPQAIVEQLIRAVGLRPVYVGGVEQAPLLDNLTRLWFALAMQQGRGRHLAFKLLQGEGR